MHGLAGADEGELKAVIAGRVISGSVTRRIPVHDLNTTLIHSKCTRMRRQQYSDKNSDVRRAVNHQSGSVCGQWTLELAGSCRQRKLEDIFILGGLYQPSLVHWGPQWNNNN